MGRPEPRQSGQKALTEPAGYWSGQHPGAPASRAPQVLGARSFQKGEGRGSSKTRVSPQQLWYIARNEVRTRKEENKEGAVRTREAPDEECRTQSGDREVFAARGSTSGQQLCLAPSGLALQP